MVQKKYSKEKNKFLDSHYLVKWVLLPFLLFLFWISLSLVNLNTNLGISVLTYVHSKAEILSSSTSELLTGQIIRGEFAARDNNLGIVAVRFNTFFRINEDVVIFRIKEKGGNKWYYQYGYTTPQFQPNKYFTFGFPIISNSEGKTYDFEIESTKGERENAVALSSVEPIFETKYQYSKESILHDFKYASKFLFRKAIHPGGENNAIDFVTRKTINSFTNTDFVISSIVYATPLILYLIWLFFFNKYLFDKYYLTLIPIIFMIIAAFFNITNNDSAVIGLTLLWVVLSWVYKLKSTSSFLLAFIFIIISPILLYSSFEIISKNFTMWGYMLLVVGVFQQIFELKWQDKKFIGFAELKEVYFSRKKSIIFGTKS